jgi:hypothetical protein
MLTALIVIGTLLVAAKAHIVSSERECEKFFLLLGLSPEEIAERNRQRAAALDRLI